MYRVGVYGTLKKGFPNHSKMLNKENGLARFVKNAVTKYKYPLVIASCTNTPYLLNQKGTGHVG